MALHFWDPSKISLPSLHYRRPSTPPSKMWSHHFYYFSFFIYLFLSSSLLSPARPDRRRYPAAAARYARSSSRPPRRTSCSTPPPWTSSSSTWPAASPGARAPTSLFSSPWPPLPAGPQLNVVTPPNPGCRGVVAALDRARCAVRRAIPGRRDLVGLACSPRRDGVGKGGGELVVFDRRAVLPCFRLQRCELLPPAGPPFARPSAAGNRSLGAGRLDLAGASALCFCHAR
jgi:hypothetical protein